MGINWIRIRDESPKDNGRIQKLLVCTNRKVSSFQNCDIEIAYFTDHFHKDGLIADISQITHWAKIDKPDDLKIQGTTEGFEEYITSGFIERITEEYREL